ncbi:helix-turn-helix domain-containing protein [Ancylobacter sp. 6x-1]|uniref:Helix-turn-helix domain-containing protein n=1 Tax=Ancylobacter crimeensis TaxID=2579147 RepID=A0ABT0D617_9HYPH|nr:helix-turn-helix domain-containing protein [Ancylobacter crimeensis]MCK0195388.1 helix-turn-helix domain-containing protein [Ancylobacter crimeensis]
MERSSPCLSPAQCRAARGFLDWTQDELAAAAGVSRSTIRDFEVGRHALHRATEAVLVRTFEGAGICLLPDDGAGCGVRLRPVDDAGSPDAK